MIIATCTKHQHASIYQESYRSYSKNIKTDKCWQKTHNYKVSLALILLIGPSYM